MPYRRVIVNEDVNLNKINCTAILVYFKDYKRMLDTPSEPIASFKNLRVEFDTKDGKVIAVEDISFQIQPGQTVCLVGESGSGKSGSSLSMMRLVEFGGGK